MNAAGRGQTLGELGSWPFLALALAALVLCVTSAFDRPPPVAPPGAGEYLRMPPRFYLVRGEDVALTQPAAELHAAPPSRARWEDGPEGGVRIVIESLTPEEDRDDWAIQLIACEFPLAAGERFRVTWDARADQPRSMVAQVSQSAPPWSGLGCYQTVPLGPSWEQASVEFEASQAAPEARLVFNLGAGQAAVEIRDVIVARVKPTEIR